MKSLRIFRYLIILGFTAQAAAFDIGDPLFMEKMNCQMRMFERARAQRVPRPIIDAVTNWMMQKHLPGKFGPRFITNYRTERDDRPDPDGPVQIETPDGKKWYVISLSGPRIVVLNDVNELGSGGTQLSLPVKMYNQHGFLYAGEPGLPYAWSSAVWDLALFNLTINGRKELWGSVGAMANNADGQPLTMLSNSNNTLQRSITRMRWVEDPSSPIGYSLEGQVVRTPFNSVIPTDGSWLLRDANGNPLFNHSYGGTPKIFPNGDIYSDKYGIPFFLDTVVEVGADGKPSLTAINVVWMDPTLTRVLKGPIRVLSPLRPDGTVYTGAMRSEYGDLVEGLHVTVRDASGRPFQSMAEVEAYRRRGGVEHFTAMFSGGYYNGLYGAFQARGSGSIANLQPVVDKNDELYDLLEIFRPLITWGGRPMEFQLPQGNLIGLNPLQEMILAHGVIKSSVSAGARLIGPPSREHFPTFWRQIMSSPTEQVVTRDGRIHTIFKDNTGLIKFLLMFSPHLREIYEDSVPYRPEQQQMRDAA